MTDILLRPCGQKQIGYKVPRPDGPDGEQKQHEEQEKVDNGTALAAHASLVARLFPWRVAYASYELPPVGVGLQRSL